MKIAHYLKSLFDCYCYFFLPWIGKSSSLLVVFFLFFVCWLALDIVLNAMGQDLGPKLEKQPLSADTPWVDPIIDDSDFNKQMLQVAKLIQISKNEEFVEVTR